MGRYVVNDLRVTRERDFTAVAVTAHQWVPMEEVGVDAIPEYLERLKSEEGFSIVAVEQTSESTSLGREERLSDHTF